MAKKKVLVMGSSGMLGMMVTKVLLDDKDIETVGTVQNESALSEIKELKDGLEIKFFDASASEEEISKLIKGFDWVINAIGIIKPYIHDDNPAETTRAIKINALFPHNLALAAEKQGVKVIQIATDCVYSGQKGKYIETDPQDALDVYGKTKSLGEAYSPNIFHLRCSIIGPEPKAHVSLMDWFLGQAKNASVNGFSNHMWNGVTTYQFAKLCIGIIKNDPEMGHIQHVIPSGSISKYEMLTVFAKEFDREDLEIKKTEADKVIDRTLETMNKDKNDDLWKDAGYDKAPSVPEMIAELAKYWRKK